jgi:uncharacterized membrane protein YhiD involved in acid resistance
MGNIQTFNNFFLAQVIQESVGGFILNLILSALMSYWIGRVYIKYGESLSNRSIFAKNFVLLTMTTMVVISIVKSSLALSLGLIGALSIVRFRAAIKEPEELCYLFLSIAVGLGLGANQRFTTVLAVCVIIGIIHVSYSFTNKTSHKWERAIYLTITSSHPDTLTLEKVNEILKNHCPKFKLDRMDKTEAMIDIVFLIELSEIHALHLIETTLRQIDSQLKITVLDYK